MPHTPSRPPTLTSPRTVCPPFDTRQRASVFNQPLSFDTSSVTGMTYMFRVRSALALQPSSWAVPVHAACAAAAPMPSRLPLASRGPHLARNVCPRSDSAGSVGVQPAAELQHLQRHRHELYVLGTWPAPTICSRGLPCALVAPLSRAALPSAGPQTSPRIVCALVGAAASVDFQPAANPRHVQRHRHELDVLRALLPCPAPSLQFRPPSRLPACTPRC